MSDWQQVKLGDVARVQSGYAFKSQDWVESGVPVVKIQNVRSGRVTLDGCSYVTDEVASAAARFSLRRGDVLVTMSGEIGSIGVVRDEGKLLLNQRVGRVEITAPEAISLGFLGYVLQHPHLKEQMVAVAYGAAQPNISPALLASLPLLLPDRPTQDRVVAVLLSIDDLIENNTRRIEILEEMAQSIYREWFVNFCYPGHEAVPLVDSELGPIPESWSVSTVGDIAELVRGRSYRSNELAEEGGLPFFNLKCIERDGGFRKSGIKRYTGKYNENQKTSAGDIVVAVTDMTQERRLVARAARIPTVGEPFGIISLDLAKLIPFEGLGSDYLLGMLRFSGFADEVKNHANGVNVLHLHPQRIVEFRFALAPSPLRHRYCEVVAPMFALADVLRMSGEQLRLTRDLLLPRLISGEVDVSELDIDVGELVT